MAGLHADCIGLAVVLVHVGVHCAHNVWADGGAAGADRQAGKQQEGRWFRDACRGEARQAAVLDGLCSCMAAIQELQMLMVWRQEHRWGELAACCLDNAQQQPSATATAVILSQSAGARDRRGMSF